jgi:hypothetical protein
MRWILTALLLLGLSFASGCPPQENESPLEGETQVTEGEGEAALGEGETPVAEGEGEVPSLEGEGVDVIEGEAPVNEGEDSVSEGEPVANVTVPPGWKVIPMAPKSTSGDNASFLLFNPSTGEVLSCKAGQDEPLAVHNFPEL